jgi:hypothetical protein
MQDAWLTRKKDSRDALTRSKRVIAAQIKIKYKYIGLALMTTRSAISRAFGIIFDGSGSYAYNAFEMRV